MIVSLFLGLPYSHCSQSRLVCYMSGTLLNENNLPMMLPNGYVYGEQASYSSMAWRAGVSNMGIGGGGEVLLVLVSYIMEY